MASCAGLPQAFACAGESSKPWRLSSSVVILAPRVAVPDCEYTNPAGDGFDYCVCCVKRAARSTFMPDTMVFPGGAVDAEDRALASALLCDDSLNAAIRCAAVREAFEESGVGILDPAPAMDSVSCDEWRKKVHKDASQFRELCQATGALPACGSLHYWCSFITPDMEHDRQPKGGFDARFFVWCASEHDVKQAAPDRKETVSLVWLTPGEALAAVQAKRIAMVPPQWYIFKELADSCPQMASVGAYASSPERALQRDYPIKPYPIQLGAEEKARLLQQEAAGAAGGSKPPPVFAMAFPGDEAHPVFPGAMGDRHRVLVAGVFGQRASFELQRRGPAKLPLRETREGWYTLAKL